MIERGEGLYGRHVLSKKREKSGLFDGLLMTRMEVAISQESAGRFHCSVSRAKESRQEASRASKT